VPRRGLAADRGLLLIGLAAVAGLGTSAYLTLTHIQAVPLACPTGAVVDCALVTQGGYGVVAGSAVPTSVPGLVFFAVGLVLAAVAARAAERRLLVLALLAAWCAGGLLVVLYLVYVEIVVLQRICEWCTATHALVLLMLLLTLSRLQAAALRNRQGDTSRSRF
jgi:uncharacterized membrane protein